ncbi:MAG: hypothetical protein ACI8UO_003023 [Verrucomicrobiales bacterium]|jgi:hypothetical protein
MKIKLLIPFLNALALGLGSAISADEELTPARVAISGDAQKVEAARAILGAYHSENPQAGDRKLHIICWRTADRDFAEDHRGRLQRIMEHIQKFYADEMERHGFGRRTIQLDYDADDQLVIHEATGAGGYADYGRPDGERIQKECWPVLKKAGIDPDHETVLIFTNLAKWDPDKNTFFHKSPYYARGHHRGGLAWQLDSAELDTDNLHLKKPMIRDGEYGRISLGKHISIFVGGIAHELGHGLGLPHCRERDDEAAAFGTALMGSGNRSYFDQARGEGKGSFITLAHALRLASHPQFSGSVKGMNLPAKAEFSGLKVEPEAKRFSISGTVKASIPVYAVIAYLDPDGGSDYDARTISAVPDENGNFALKCDALVSGKPAAIRLVACLANGATSTWSSTFDVAKDGAVDVAVMQVSLELSEFIGAMNERDFARAAEIRDRFPEESKSRAIAAAVLQGRRNDRKTVAAADVPAENDLYPLSQVTPAEATVGWAQPAYDHLPRPDALLISGGELFETGIYAHAESRHLYDLAGSDWKQLTGKVGLPNQRGGTVVFAIKADGKEVFRSRKIEPGKTQAFEIDLADVDEIELITTDAGDGKAGDWGLWLGAELRR